MKTLLASAAAFAIFGASAAMAEVVEYDFDPTHAQVVFEYNHMGFSTSIGIINGVTGKVMLDAEDPAASMVEATIPLSGLHSVDGGLDAHLFTEDFFNAAQADTVATFKSTGVEVSGEKDARVTGDLTLNGVTKEVVLDVVLNQMGAHPLNGKQVAGFNAQTMIKRSDFNLGKYVPAVGDELKVNISVEAGKPE